MDDLYREIIGFAAGSIVTAAALPRLRDIVRNHDVALNESYSRNAMIAGGNFIWVFYGVMEDAIALAVMCGLSTLFNGMILWSVFIARRRRAKMAT